MSLALEYTIGPVEIAAQHELFALSGLQRAKVTHLRFAVFWLAVSIAGLVASVMAKSAFLTIAFVAIVVGQALYIAIYPGVFAKVSAKQFAAQCRQKVVRLLVDDEGLHETTEYMESFAPWRAVQSYLLVRGVVFVELSAGLWCVVPALGRDTELLIEFLKLKSVPYSTRRIS